MCLRVFCSFFVCVCVVYCLFLFFFFSSSANVILGTFDIAAREKGDQNSDCHRLLELNHVHSF